MDKQEEYSLEDYIDIAKAANTALKVVVSLMHENQVVVFTEPDLERFRAEILQRTIAAIVSE